MDRAEVERLLGHVNSEKADAQRELAYIQERLNKLTKASDGLESLLDMTPKGLSGLVGSGPDSGHPAEPTKAVAPSVTGTVALRVPSSPAFAPKGKEAAKLILVSDTSKFWTIQDVHNEQVRRGWAEPRPSGKKRNAPARIALQRLQMDFPNNVDVIEKPVLAYRWSDRPSPSFQGSGAHSLGDES